MAVVVFAVLACLLVIGLVVGLGLAFGYVLTQLHRQQREIAQLDETLVSLCEAMGLGDKPSQHSRNEHRATSQVMR